MIDLAIWITILGVIATYISLIIGILSYRHNQLLLKDINKNQEKQIKILKRQVKRLVKGQPKNEQIEREKLELKRKEQENKEKWKQVDAIFKTIKFFKDFEN